MKTRTIGRTGLAVTEFSFGTAALGGLYRACPRDVAMATLDAAWDEGLRYFDTAPWYGFGLAERRTGDFLRDKPKGSYVLSSGFFDAYYLQAQKARTLLINEFNALFEKYDALIGPVAPTTAFKLGENTADPVKMYLADIMTVPASLAGLPAVSVPAGKTEAGLPVGVQLIGPRKSDALLLALARQGEV